MTAYSIYLQLSVTEDHIIHLQPKYVPCHVDRALMTWDKDWKITRHFIHNLFLMMSSQCHFYEHLLSINVFLKTSHTIIELDSTLNKLQIRSY